MARLLAMDFRTHPGNEVNLDNVQRFLEAGDRQGSPMYRAFAWSSTTMTKKLVKAVKEQMAMRAELEKALGQ